jgi:photosystem II stability/assembly factor-like uncharacterized protein
VIGVSSGEVSRLVAATGNGIALLDEEAGRRRARVTPLAGLQCLAAGDGTVLAGSRGGGVHVSRDGAETWAKLNFSQPDVFSVAVGPDGTLYAGCEPSMLFRSGDGGETWKELESLRAIPSAPTWSFPPRPWTSHVRWIAPSPHDARRLLVGIELGGLMVSEDGGETWHDHRPGAQPDVHSLAWHPGEPGRAYEAGGGGAAWSDDGGLTWHPADDGRDRHYTWAVAVDPDDPDTWFVSASPGPFKAHRVGTADALVYRRRGGGAWEALAGGLPQPLDAMPYALVFADGRLVAGLADGRLYASEDRGDTWAELDVDGDPISRIVALVAV